MLRTFLMSALFSVAIGGSAQATPPQAAATGAPHTDCFYGSSINGFSLRDRHTVDVTVGANRHYLLTTDWDAHELNWSEAIALRSTNGWICTGNGIGVEIIGGRPRQIYPILSIARAPQAPPAANAHTNTNKGTP